MPLTNGVPGPSSHFVKETQPMNQATVSSPLSTRLEQELINMKHPRILITSTREQHAALFLQCADALIHAHRRRILLLVSAQHKEEVLHLWGSRPPLRSLTQAVCEQSPEQQQHVFLAMLREMQVLHHQGSPPRFDVVLIYSIPPSGGSVWHTVLEGMGEIPLIGFCRCLTPQLRALFSSGRIIEGACAEHAHDPSEQHFFP